jgi:hypothetical protein
MVALMHQHPRHRRVLSAGFVTAVLVAAMLAAQAAPAAAGGSWYPVPVPLPSTFSCGATKPGPTGVYHQTCLHFANGAARGAYIVSNRSGSTKRIDAAEIYEWSWSWRTPGGPIRAEAHNYCNASAITSPSTRVCYGGYATMYAGRSYRARGRLMMNGVWNPWDFSPITNR